ncbi:hypothetical protein OpiT1DRAFT_04192 [Opitutaceae bacterium TAV1]|nr:hypothetical protein OpiT1DRAFT_04192 [Opitutaceae bacterium TAV1]
MIKNKEFQMSLGGASLNGKNGHTAGLGGIPSGDEGEDASHRELTERFMSPPAAWRGKPFWSWNGVLRPDELLRQTAVLREMGMGGAFMHSRTGLGTEYLGKEWFELVNACADEFGTLGLEGWLYDEDRWPSGSAGGLATRKNGFRMQYLRLTVCDVAAARAALAGGADAVAVFAAQVNGFVLGDYRLLSRDAGIPAPEILPGESVLLFTRELMPEHSFYNGATYLDTMNADATRHFINITHERYLAACGDRIGRTITGIFTDEPHRGFVMCDSNEQAGPANPGWVTPWTGCLPVAFRERWGYDLTGRLPELFLKRRGSPVSPVKWHYMELAQTLFIENWAKPVHAWCREHGLRLTGHVLHEDTLGAQAAPCGSVMRYYEHMDVPGVDILGRGNRNYWIVKQLASVARQQGRVWMLSELYGCTGWQLDFSGHKEIGDWQAFLGINVRCHHLSWYTMAGEAKRDYPASIFFQSSWYREYKYVEDYYARLHVMLQRGEAVCELLVVHPVESLWAQVHAGWATWLKTRDPDLLALEEVFEDTFHWLAAAGTDFDYGDEDHFARFGAVGAQGGSENGDLSGFSPSLRVGRARYRTVLVSGCVTLRRTTMDLLDAFVKAGGTVLFAGAPPACVDALPSEEPALLAARSHSVDFRRDVFISKIRELSPYPLRIKEPDGNAGLPSLVTQLRRDGDDWIVALHHPAPDQPRAGCALSLDVSGMRGMRMRVEEWDARTGRRSLLPSHIEEGAIVWETSFPPLGERVFVVTPRTDDAPAMRIEPEIVARRIAEGPFYFELDEPNVLVLDRPEWLAGDAGSSGASAWHPHTEILKIDEALRDELGLPQRSGMMIQPWARPATDTAAAPSSSLRLRHRIHIRNTPPDDAVLALEQPSAWRARLNGRELDLGNDAGWFVDPCLRRIPIPAGWLKTGENTLELSTHFHAGLDLEACYLLGTFGVWMMMGEGNVVVDRLPDTLAVGDVTVQGLPFYSGRIRYRLPLPAAANGDETGLRLDLPRFGGAVAVLRPTGANGDEVTILAFPPHQADLGDAFTHAGNLICEIVLTRRNLFGPLHQVPKTAPEIGPVSFRTKGETWSDDYQLLPSGLLGTPVFVTQNK